MRRVVLACNRVLGHAESLVLAGLVLAITAVTFAQVFSRYVLGSPLIWTEEAARYLFVWITLIGGAAAVRLNAHFGLDILRRSLPPWLRLPLGLLTSLIVSAFLVILLLTGIAETRQAWMQTSTTLPMRMHWPYLALPVGAAAALWHVLAHWCQTGPSAHPLDGETA